MSAVPDPDHGVAKLARASKPPRTERPEQALRRLFLTVFLRGRSARGLTRRNVPTSVPGKLAMTLVFYALFGLFCLFWRRQSVLVFSTCLHAMTFVFLGTFVAASAGELLFNKQEGDILLHRPVTPRALLWAKIAMLVQVSLWIAGAFNLIGLFVGIGVDGSSFRYPFAHVISTALVAVLCTSSVVLVYELCLRWFGRERLDSLITFSQVLLAITAMLIGQAPRFLMRFDGVAVDLNAWWVVLLPPAWFAGLDDALAGRGGLTSWGLGALGIAVTGLVMRLALGRLAADYTHGLRILDEVRAEKPTGGRVRRRFIAALTTLPPFSLWLRDPVARSGFLLSLAYLARSRDTKLRVYPGVAPMFVLPLVLFTGGSGKWGGGGFAVAFSGAYIGLIPMLVLELLQYSQDSAAADVFRLAPIAGPARLVAGTRFAVLSFATLPLVGLLALFTWLTQDDVRHLLLLLPGLVALPIYTLVPSLGGKGVPLSLPSEGAQSAGRGLFILGSMCVALCLAGLSTWSWTGGWFWEFLGAEALVGIGVHALLGRSISRARWAAD